MGIFSFYGRGGGPYHAPTASMKILGWNCRGICNASTVRALKAQIKRAKPDFIFLSETKALFSRMDSVKRSVNFDHLLVVEAKGSAGGLVRDRAPGPLL